MLCLNLYANKTLNFLIYTAFFFNLGSLGDMVKDFSLLTLY